MDITEQEKEIEVRLDKWLWVARFFKTRALAQMAVNSGKVYYNGSRVRPTQRVDIGASIRIQCGPRQRTVIVRGVTKQRRAAEFLSTLYEETETSIARRYQQQDHRRSENEPRSPYGHDQYPQQQYQKPGRRYLRRIKSTPYPDEEGE